MDYQDQVNFQYAQLVSTHQKQMKKSTTGIREVLQFLLDKKEEKIWWWSWEFVGKTTSKGGYLSHRAPARASDLALHHTELVEDRHIGRFCVYRLKKENLNKVTEFLK